MSEKKRFYYKIADGDVYRNYKWSMNDQVYTPYRNEVPIITMTEYGVESSRAMSQFREEFSKVKKLTNEAIGFDIKDLGNRGYSQLYHTTEQLNLYKFPFFSTYNHRIANNWGDAISMFVTADKIEMGISNVSSIVNGYGSVLRRKEWDSTQEAAYTFNFTLYNTYGEEEIIKNYNLIRTLITNNLTQRTGLYTLISPVIYTVDIPGVRYSPASCIQNLKIDNIGQINRKKINIGQKHFFAERGDSNNSVIRDVHIPDAWNIEITLLDLLPETANMFNAGIENEQSKVSVVSTKSEFYEEVGMNTVKAREKELRKQQEQQEKQGK